MGRSVDLYHYDEVELLSALSAWSGKDDEQRLRDILASCGSFLGGIYVLLNNEMAPEGMNPYYLLFSLLDAEYKTDDMDETAQDAIYSCSDVRGLDCVNGDEIAERLGITLEDE